MKELRDALHRVRLQALELRDSPTAGMVAELAEILSYLLREPPPERLEVGVEYDLTLRVRATVVEVHDGHGLAYELKLETRDFYAGRTVSIDHDELALAKLRR